MASHIETSPYTLNFQADSLHSGSISFGRFENEALCWERRSSFLHNRHLEDAEKYSRSGSVNEKKAYFEAHFKRRALMKQASSGSQNGADYPSSENDFSETTSYEYDNFGSFRERSHSARFDEYPVREIEFEESYSATEGWTACDPQNELQCMRPNSECDTSKHDQVNMQEVQHDEAGNKNLNSGVGTLDRSCKASNVSINEIVVERDNSVNSEHQTSDMKFDVVDLSGSHPHGGTISTASSKHPDDASNKEMTATSRPRERKSRLEGIKSDRKVVVTQGRRTIESRRATSDVESRKATPKVNSRGATSNVDSRRATSVESRKATSTGESRKAASNVNSRGATLNLDSRKVTSNLDSRRARSVESKKATSNGESRKAASNVNSRGATSNLDSRKATSNLDSRKATSNLDSRRATSVESKKATSNGESRKRTPNVNSRGATSNGESRKAASNVNSRGATSNVDSRRVTSVESRKATSNGESRKPASNVNSRGTTSNVDSRRATSVESRKATSNGESRKATSNVSSRGATSNVDSRRATSVESRKATSNLSSRGATSNVDSRRATSVESRKATSNGESRKPASNVNSRGATSNLDSRRATFVESRKATSNVDSRGATSNVDSRGATSSVDSRGATSSVDSRGATSSVDSRGATSSVDSRGATSSCDSRGATSSCDSGKATSNIDSRGATSNVDSQRATSVESRKAASNGESRKPTSNVDSKGATSNVESRRATPNVESRKATSNVSSKNLVGRTTKKEETDLLRLKREKVVAISASPITKPNRNRLEQKVSHDSKTKPLHLNRSADLDSRTRRTVNSLRPTSENVVYKLNSSVNGQDFGSSRPGIKQNDSAFSFKSDERVEKRKEFISKPEEKIHTKEAEIHQLQAKKQEKIGPEIKQLTKSLNFKATPTASSYHESDCSIDKSKGTSSNTKSRTLRRPVAGSETCGRTPSCSEAGSERAPSASEPLNRTRLQRDQEVTSSPRAARPKSSSLSAAPESRTLRRRPVAGSETCARTPSCSEAGSERAPSASEPLNKTRLQRDQEVTSSPRAARPKTSSRPAAPGCRAPSTLGTPLTTNKKQGNEKHQSAQHKDAVSMGKVSNKTKNVVERPKLNSERSGTRVARKEMNGAGLGGSTKFGRLAVGVAS